jgi:hypothetical protein
MSRVLTIDPGANPGFCLIQDGEIQFADHTTVGHYVDDLDELIIEGQYAATHIYRNGRRVRVSRASQQGLSFTAGRLFERYPAARKYRIQPSQWRSILWPGATRLPKPVVLARLRTTIDPALYAHVPKKNPPEVIEAIGIALAWAKLTPARKKKYEYV